MPDLQGLGFDTNLATALSERADTAALQKMMNKWRKSLTPQQKVRQAAVAQMTTPKLKSLIAQRLTGAQQSVREQAAKAVVGLKDKEALAFFLIDLEYGVVGSMPPKPLKTGNKDKLFGKSVKFGSPDGPEREGIVIGVNKPKKGEPTLQLLVAGEKAPVEVADDQIVGIGDAKVEQTETWTKQAAPHKFSSREANQGAETVPAEKKD